MRVIFAGRRPLLAVYARVMYGNDTATAWDDVQAFRQRARLAVSDAREDYRHLARIAAEQVREALAR